MNKLNSNFADDVIWISCSHMHRAGEKWAHTLTTFKLMICLICHLSLHGGKCPPVPAGYFFFFIWLKGHSSPRLLHVVSRKMGIKERHGSLEQHSSHWYLGAYISKIPFKKEKKLYNTAYFLGLELGLCLWKLWLMIASSLSEDNHQKYGKCGRKQF